MLWFINFYDNAYIGWICDTPFTYRTKFIFYDFVISQVVKLIAYNIWVECRYLNAHIHAMSIYFGFTHMNLSLMRW